MSILRCALGLLVGCGAATAPPAHEQVPPEVQAFWEGIEACDQPGEAANDACQEALEAGVSCEDGGAGALCDHFRAEGRLPPNPPPVETLFGCWRVIEAEDHPAASGGDGPAALQPARPRPTHLCLEAESLLFGWAGSWDRWRVGEGGYVSRLERSDLSPPAIPSFETVCGAAQRCMDALVAAAHPPQEGAPEGPGPTVELRPWRVSDCHCRMLAAARGEAGWPFDGQWGEWDAATEPPAACDLEALPYEAAFLPTCETAVRWF